MELGIKAGSTGHTRYFILRRVDTGLPVTGLAYNSAGLVANYRRQRSAVVDIALATLANNAAAWASGGFIEVDAAKRPGEYRIDLPDAAIAAGSSEVTVAMNGTVGGVVIRGEEYRIPLTTFDPLTEGTTAQVIADAFALAPTAAYSGAAAGSAGLLLSSTSTLIAAFFGAAGTLTANAIAAVRGAVETAGGVLALLAAKIQTNLTNNPLSAAATQAAVETGGGLLAVTAGRITGAMPTANQNADALLDRVDAIGTGLSPRMALRAIFAGGTVGGLRDGFDGTTNPNTFHVRSLGGGQVIAYTGIADVNGNVTAAAWNLTVLADATKW